MVYLCDFHTSLRGAASLKTICYQFWSICTWMSVVLYICAELKLLSRPHQLLNCTGCFRQINLHRCEVLSLPCPWFCSCQESWWFCSAQTSLIQWMVCFEQNWHLSCVNKSNRCYVFLIKCKKICICNFFRGFGVFLIVSCHLTAQ